MCGTEAAVVVSDDGRLATVLRVRRHVERIALRVESVGGHEECVCREENRVDARKNVVVRSVESVDARGDALDGSADVVLASTNATYRRADKVCRSEYGVDRTANLVDRTSGLVVVSTNRTSGSTNALDGSSDSLDGSNDAVDGSVDVVDGSEIVISSSDDVVVGSAHVVDRAVDAIDPSTNSKNVEDDALFTLTDIGRVLRADFARAPVASFAARAARETGVRHAERLAKRSRGRSRVGEATRRAKISGVRFPRLLGHIERGEIHLTALLLLRDHFTDDNLTALVAATKGKTKREIQVLIAARAPRPDVRPTIEPLSPSRHRLELTISDELRAKLERARDLMGHRIPDGNLEAILEHAADALIAKLEKERLARTVRPQVHPRASRPGHVPDAVRREVFARDGERCTHVDDQGNRCASRVARTTASTPNNASGADTSSNGFTFASAGPRIRPSTSPTVPSPGSGSARSTSRGRCFASGPASTEPRPRR